MPVTHPERARYAAYHDSGARFVRLTVLLVLVGACRDDRPQAPEVPLTLRIEPAAVVFDGLGRSIAVTARLGDRATGRPEISIESERRWLHDLPVLDADSLALGVLHAKAPGSVNLTVAAFGQTATLTAAVQPTGPVVMQILGSEWLLADETVSLRGYRLNEDVGEITLAGSVATVLQRDSATLTLRFEPPPAGPCGVSTDTIRLPRAQVVTSLARYRAHGTLLTLTVGETSTPSAEDLSCVILPAGTRYALAYFDPSRVERARTQYEGGGPHEWLEFTVTPEVLPGAVSAGGSRPHATGRSMATPLRGAAAAHVPHDPPHMRTTPWTEGELFAVSAAVDLEVQARVQRIYDGRYVLAAEHDLGADTVASFVQTFDSIMPAFLLHTVPFYQAVFSERTALTSTASDQFLILVARSCFSGFAIEREDAHVARSVGWVVLGVCYVDYSAPRYGDLDHLFNHEMAHIWSFIYAFDQIGQRGLGGTAWGLEGVATLMAQEVLRRRLNIGLLSNYDAGGDRHDYALAVVHRGMLTDAYRNSASFLRDLLVRRVRRGESYETALRDVARGGVDGWYGHTWCCTASWTGGTTPSWPDRPDAALHGNGADARLPGLYSRMRSVDPDWEPERAVLLWTLSHAVDELTDNADLQVHSFRDAVGMARRIDPLHYWSPDVQATPLSGPQSVLRDGGNSGYSYLINDAGVGVYRITLHEVSPRLQWLITRYR